MQSKRMRPARLLSDESHRAVWSLMSELECMRLAVKARLWPRPNPPRYATLRQEAIYFRFR